MDPCAPGSPPLPGGPYTLVVATLALHTLVGHQASPEEVEARWEPPSLHLARYRAALVAILEVLEPGGHLLVGDHVGLCRLGTQLALMAEVGFTEVDVAWRQDAFFVAGGRKPVAEA